MGDRRSSFSYFHGARTLCTIRALQLCLGVGSTVFNLLRQIVRRTDFCPLHVRCSGVLPKGRISECNVSTLLLQPFNTFHSEVFSPKCLNECSALSIGISTMNILPCCRLTFAVLCGTVCLVAISQSLEARWE